ncbi:hypothetical protein DIPPA_27638 [Diplonema papillatum]|nr:hypothetical protein DIPPA_27638 [Diplonema papillatum]
MLSALVAAAVLAAVCQPAEEVSEESGVVYTPKDYPAELALDVYTPKGGGGGPAGTCVLFLHGGLWQSGSIDALSSRAFCRNGVRATGLRYVAVEYRLNTNNSCCSTSRSNGTCAAAYPDPELDVSLAMEHLIAEGTCAAASFYCVGHSAGGQMCTDLALKSDQLLPRGAALRGVVGVEGIYNLTKFYAGPKGVGFTCSVEKAFGSREAGWCAGGDNACYPGLPKFRPPPDFLFVHSPGDVLVLDQQAREITCRLNGQSEGACACPDYYSCPCLDKCLGSLHVTTASYTNNVTGSHFGVLETLGLAHAIKAFVCRA